ASGQGRTMTYAVIAAALGTIYMDAGRHADAIPVLKRLVPILENELGASSAEAMTARCDLATTHLDLKQWNDAKGVLLPIIRIGRSMTSTGSDDGDANVANRFHMVADHLV